MYIPCNMDGCLQVYQFLFYAMYYPLLFVSERYLGLIGAVNQYNIWSCVWGSYMYRWRPGLSGARLVTGATSGSPYTGTKPQTRGVVLCIVRVFPHHNNNNYYYFISKKGFVWWGFLPWVRLAACPETTCSCLHTCTYSIASTNQSFIISDPPLYLFIILIYLLVLITTVHCVATVLLVSNCE